MGAANKTNKAAFSEDLDDDSLGVVGSVRLRGNAEPIAWVGRAFKLMAGEEVTEKDESGEESTKQLNQD